MRPVRKLTLTTVMLLGLPTAAFAASAFPRGPGLYLNLLSFALILGLYFAWLALCTWIERDARRLDLERTRWNALVVAGGLLGVVVFWLVPWFAVALPLLLGLLATPAVLYVLHRNSLVVQLQQVGTEQHLRKLARRYLQLDLGESEETPAGPEVHFLPKPGEELGLERVRTRRSQTLRGYPPALELVCDAVQRRATELHLEPLQEKANVRLQIDGVFHDTLTLPRPAEEAVLEVIKTWAGVDTGELARTLQGLFVAEIDGGRVVFHAQFEPAGAHAHLKLLIEDHTQRILRFDQLGMRERVREGMQATLGVSSGLLLVCGPADSGRTTTAYACLNELDRMRRSILTIEDTVHQRLTRFEQVPLQRAAGDTFASALRRLTPGAGARIVFVGAIDDQETAEVVIQKAEEGRLVLATIPGHDAVTGLYRLIELGVAPERLAGVILGVLCQRLIRLLCDSCKVRYHPDPDAVRRANLSPEQVNLLCRIPDDSELQHDDLGRVVPCLNCRGLGYHGRTGLFEYLVVTERMRELLKTNASVTAIKQEAVKSGMSYLQDEALQVAIRGLTSIPEMIQVLKE